MATRNESLTVREIWGQGGWRESVLSFWVFLALGSQGESLF